MDFVEPITYPLKDLKKLIIGGLLIFPGIILLLIPYLMAIGYSIKVAGETVRGKDELPEYDDWNYFLMKGLGYIGIDIVYGIIMIVAFIPAMILFIAGTAGEENTVLIILAVILGIIALILTLIISFLEMIALVRYGEKENIGAAFAFGEIFKNLKANLKNYIIGFIILLVLFVVLYIVMVVAMMTVVGILFIGIILFYIILVEFRMFAQIYKESKESNEKLDIY